MNRRIKASLISILTDVVLIVSKLFLSYLSGSAALWADAYHSLSDLFVSLGVLVGGFFRSRAEKRAGGSQPASAAETPPETPPLAEEQNGPKRKKGTPGYWIEAVIALAISLVILYLPVIIILSLSRGVDRPLKNSWIAVGGVLLCIAIAYFVSRFKMLVGRQIDSPALVADGYHSRMDMITSIAVLFSLLGQMIGIALDPIVAVVIAVLIGATGVELFINSLVGLITRTEWVHAPFWQWLQTQGERAFSALTRRVLGRVVRLSDLRLGHYLSPRRYYTRKRLAVLIGVLLGAYLLSGFAFLKPGEIGTSFCFGRIVETDLEPGPHWSPPWPFGQIRYLRRDEVRRIELGFRTDPSMTGSISPSLWDTVHMGKGYSKDLNEAITLTRDESVIDLSLVLHYRIRDSVRALYRVASIESVLRGLLESVMREVVSAEDTDSLLVEDRQGALNAIRERLVARIAKLNLGVEVLAVLGHDLHPPTQVVGAFRGVFSAREEMATLLSRAEGQRNDDLPKARADSESKRLAAAAQANEQKTRAAGDAAKFSATSEAFKHYAELTAFRLYIEMTENTLVGKRKFIVSPKIAPGAYRLWLDAPEMLTKSGPPIALPASPNALPPKNPGSTPGDKP